jgi:hypothetical protein
MQGFRKQTGLIDETQFKFLALPFSTTHLDCQTARMCAHIPMEKVESFDSIQMVLQPNVSRI